MQRAGLLDSISFLAPPIAEPLEEQDDLPGITSILLSFPHFLELLALDRQLQRAFYEVQAVENS